MGIFYRKPFFLCCFFVLLGAFFSTFSDRRAVFTTVTVAFFLSVLLFIVSIIRKSKLLLFSFSLPLLCIAISSIYFFSFIQTKNEQIEKYVDDLPHEMEAVVVSRSYISNYLSIYDIKCYKIDESNIKINIRIEAPFHLELETGDKLRTNGVFSIPEQKQYYNSKGIYLFAEITSDEVEKIGEDNNFVLKLARLRDEMTSVIHDKIENDEAAGLVCAVFLGDRDGLSMNAKRDFKRTGGYHLLALSGMHLSVFCAAVNALLCAFKLRKGKRYIVLIFVVAFYVALTGFQLSMVRSAIMIFATFAGYYLRSRRDALTSLAFAAAAIIIFSPSSVTDIGLWMSVLATFGIILATPFEAFMRFKLRRIRNKIARKSVSYVASVFIFSIVAIVMVFPFSCFYFGGVSLVGPLSTLILSEAVSLILITSPIALIIFWIPFVSDLLFHMSALVARFILWASGVLSKLENVFVSLEYGFVPYLTIPFFIVLFILLTVRLKRKWIVPLFIVIWIAVFAVFEFAAINSPTMVVEYIKLGKNEYFSVSHQGKNVLVDITDGSYAKLSAASEYASSKGYCELDAVILTHLHNRHVNSLIKLSSAYILRSVYLPKPDNASEFDIATRIEESMRLIGVTIFYYAENDTIDANGVKIDVERAYLKRSSHPVVGIAFSGKLNIRYFGSSYSEYDEITSYENVIFGVHGPVIKMDFNFDASSCSLASFASEEIFSHCTISGKDDVKIVKIPDKLVFKHN